MRTPAGEGEYRKGGASGQQESSEAGREGVWGTGLGDETWGGGWGGSFCLGTGRCRRLGPSSQEPTV